VSDGRVRPQQGDEHELFVKYSERLRRATKLAIRTTPEIVDDACAFAWMKLVSNQPDRETVFAWLRTVARNRALELDRLARAPRELSLDMHNRADYLAPASRGRVEVAQGLLELRERLEALPARQREIVVLNAAGWRYSDLAERFGVSSARIDQILASATLRMREMEIREMEPTSPRGRRLREIENDPPQYIVASIGRQPRVERKRGGEETKREWKRLVLEIEDYRKANGITDRVLPLGREVREPQRDALCRRIAHYRRDRGLDMGIGR
jgi:RNA polymerase sigma factor (sigma-70 family)